MVIRHGNKLLNGKILNKMFCFSYLEMQEELWIPKNVIAHQISFSRLIKTTSLNRPATFILHACINFLFHYSLVVLTIPLLVFNRGSTHTLY